MQALITRPVEDTGPLAALLAARGVVAVSEPLLAIRPIPGAVPDLDGVQALFFTSANGARAFAAASAEAASFSFAVNSGYIVSAPPSAASAGM